MKPSTIDLEDKHRKIILDVLHQYASDLTVYVFGSRATGTAHRYSDLDIALVGAAKEPIPAEVVWKLRDALSESDLPIKVDVVDYHAANPSFQKLISEHWVKLFPADTTGSL